MIYQLKSERSLLSSKNEERQRMKDSISNTIQTLWIHHHVIWAEECLDNLSEIDQQYDSEVSWWLCDYISEWYFNIFQHTWGTLRTCLKDVEETQEMTTLHEEVEKQVQNSESWFSKVCHSIWSD